MHPTDPDDPRILGMQKLEETLKECNTMVEKLMKDLTSSRSMKLGKRLLWPRRKAAVKDTLDTIYKFKSLLDSWLQMDIW